MLDLSMSMHLVTIYEANPEKRMPSAFTIAPFGGLGQLAADTEKHYTPGSPASCMVLRRRPSATYAIDWLVVQQTCTNDERFETASKTYRSISELRTALAGWLIRGRPPPKTTTTPIAGALEPYTPDAGTAFRHTRPRRAAPNNLNDGL